MHCDKNHLGRKMANTNNKNSYGSCRTHTTGMQQQKQQHFYVAYFHTSNNKNGKDKTTGGLGWHSVVDQVKTV